MLDYFIKSLPILIALIIYFVRLEVRLAKINKDICWIIKTLNHV